MMFTEDTMKNIDNHKDKAICKKYGLPRDMVDPRFREPFIMKGYRQPNMKPFDCLKSAFVPYCNEAVNVWTHGLAAVLFAIKFCNIFYSELSVKDPFTWPLFSYATGICGFCLMSAAAHIFNSVSPSIRHTCFFMDYAAISIYSVGAGQAFYFYTRPLRPEVYILKSPVCFGLFSLFISMLATWLCCTTRLKWHRYKYLIRTGSYVMPFLVNAFPFMYRMFYCTSDIDCESSAVPAFKKHFVFFIISALANITRFPERFIPGVFDCIGHSHHFLHIFTALGAADQFNGIKLDMVARRDFLLTENTAATFGNTLAFMLIAIAANVGLALYFGRQVEKVQYDKKK